MSRFARGAGARTLDGISRSRAGRLMGGRRGGRIPKPDDQRARGTRRRDGVQPATTLEFVKAKQPPLPARMPNGSAWPARTRAWWKRWAADPRAKRFDSAA